MAQEGHPRGPDPMVSAAVAEAQRRKRLAAAEAGGKPSRKSSKLNAWIVFILLVVAAIGSMVALAFKQ